ncbi:hypothetical protein BS17DRAFT_769165 [Gyrodon lividus]|nr:hypothetical protein BS17DRAFT_769165 [Gyrodon lividus]
MFRLTVLGGGLCTVLTGLPSWMVCSILELSDPVYNINATQQRTYNNPHQAHVPQEHVQPPCQHQQPLQSQHQYQNPWTSAGVQQQYHMPAGGATGEVAPYQVQSPPVATPQLLQSDLTNE